jgi:hypothetical protein
MTLRPPARSLKARSSSEVQGILAREGLPVPPGVSGEKATSPRNSMVEKVEEAKNRGESGGSELAIDPLPCLNKDENAPLITARTL